MHYRIASLLLALVLVPLGGNAARAQTLSDLAYASVGATTLRLDLHLPPAGQQVAVPVVVWIHGGGWCAGARAPLAAYAQPLTSAGVAVAAVQYRLTSTTPNCANNLGATWPAPLHDVKGAVRWLRANAATYGLDPARIGAWGRSAGAHLALSLALTSGNAALEGNVGGNATQSSAVAAVVAYFPPSELLSLGPDFATPPTNLPGAVAIADGPGQPHANLIGFGNTGEGMGLIRANAQNPVAPWPGLLERALSASPLTWVDDGDVPVFLLHGTADAVVPLNQSRRLRNALAAAGVPFEYREVAGLGHVPPSDPGLDQAARDWLIARLSAALPPPDPLHRDSFESRPP